jgi:hypothetical protein
MIVFDENVHQQRLMDAVAGWYRGRVLSITTLRPDTLIKDEAIPYPRASLDRLGHTQNSPAVSLFTSLIPAEIVTP